MKVQPKKKAVAVREKSSTEAPVPAPPAPATTASSAVTYVVYREAQPVEGFSHLYKYFSTELKYPEEAIRDSIQGLVTVTFMIDSQGRPGKISILNSLGPLFDAEAIRLVNNMPAWRPATIDGKPIAAKFSLPLNFQFNATANQSQKPE
jgi:TonB family protein